MPTATSSKSAPLRRRLAIVGGGSSGLICLKYALDQVRDWEIVCYERTNRITGCWGNPYPGFVSTSTKYTTQFACFPLFDATVKSDGGASREEFFRDDEYGQYLEKFAAEFSLRPHIKLKCCVERIRRDDMSGWHLTITNREGELPQTKSEFFDAVILCTGLAAEPKQLECDVPTLSLAELNHPDGLGHVRGQRIVVVGGGESAVDYASRLARPELNNDVFLSLQSGIRVSPRYHPVRGVPSDFLRNRLMLSIHEDLRNWIGQRFVEARIRHQEIFQWVFPSSNFTAADSKESAEDASDQAIRKRKKEWAYRLTKAAKDDLFNMFHNKSDDFLDAVAQARITILGPPTDRTYRKFHNFAADGDVALSPDLVVPAVGYRANLAEISGGQIHLRDFYLGCCHVDFRDLYLVGFARPIIGNIPTISEMQARYVTGQIAGRFIRPRNIKQLHQSDVIQLQRRFRHLSLDAIYPVEMFPYCDRLARLMDVFPTASSAGSFRRWCRMQLAPATTMHYVDSGQTMHKQAMAAPIYMPASLIMLLLTLKPLDAVYKAAQRRTDL